MRKSSCRRTFRRLPPLPPSLSPAAVAFPPFHYRVLPPPLAPFRGPETPRFTSFLSSSSLSGVVREQRAEDRNDFSSGSAATFASSNGSSSFLPITNSSFSSSSSSTTPVGVSSTSSSSSFCAVAPTVERHRHSERKEGEREKNGEDAVRFPPSLPPPLSPLGMMMMVNIFPSPSSSPVVPTSLASIPPIKTTWMVQVLPPTPHRGSTSRPIYPSLYWRPRHHPPHDLMNLPSRCRSTVNEDASSSLLSHLASDTSSSFSSAHSRSQYSYYHRHRRPSHLSAHSRGVASCFRESTPPECRKGGRKRKRHREDVIPLPRSHRLCNGGKKEEEKKKKTECMKHWKSHPKRRQMWKRMVTRRKTSPLSKTPRKRDDLAPMYSSSRADDRTGGGGGAASTSNPSLDKMHSAHERVTPTLAGCPAIENTQSGDRGGGRGKSTFSFSSSSSSSSSPPPELLRPCTYTADELFAALPYSSFIVLYAALRRLGFEGLPLPPSTPSSSPLPLDTIGGEGPTTPSLDGRGMAATVTPTAAISIYSSLPVKGEGSHGSCPSTKGRENIKWGISREEHKGERERQWNRQTPSKEEDKLVFFPSTVTFSSSPSTTTSSFVLPPFDLRAVKDAYRNLVKKLHPDLGGGDGTEMERINTAYQRVKHLSLVQQAAYSFWVSRKDGARLIQEQEEEEGVDIMDMDDKEFVMPPASVHSTTQGTSVDPSSPPSSNFFFSRSSPFSASFSSTAGFEGLEMVFGCFYVTLFLSLWWWWWWWKGKSNLYASKTADSHGRTISFYVVPSTTTEGTRTSSHHRTTPRTAKAVETAPYEQTVRYWLSFLFCSPPPPSPPPRSSLSIWGERCRNGVSEVVRIPEKYVSALLPHPPPPLPPATFSFSSLWSFFFSFPQRP